MIEIANGNFLIDGKIITNPELIGFAMLDFAETAKSNCLIVKLSDSKISFENDAAINIVAMIEKLESELLDLKAKQDEYIKIARNDENLNEEIRAIQKQIQELKK